MLQTRFAHGPDHRKPNPALASAIKRMSPHF
jgi:hypothetical protein